jgi:hypothetical protein
MPRSRLQIERGARIRLKRILYANVAAKSLERAVSGMAGRENFSIFGQGFSCKSRAQRVAGIISRIEADRANGALYDQTDQISTDWFRCEFPGAHVRKYRAGRCASQGNPRIQRAHGAGVRVSAERHADFSADAGLILLFAPDVDHKPTFGKLDIGELRSDYIRPSQCGCKAKKQYRAVAHGSAILPNQVLCDRPQLFNSDRGFLSGLLAAGSLCSFDDLPRIDQRRRLKAGLPVMVEDGRKVSIDRVNSPAADQVIGNIEIYRTGAGGQAFIALTVTPAREEAPIVRVTGKGVRRSHGARHAQACLDKFSFMSVSNGE